MAVQIRPPCVIRGASGDLGQVGQRVLGQVRPANLIRGTEGGQNATPQENAGVDARILATAVCVLVSDESTDVQVLNRAIIVVLV